MSDDHWPCDLLTSAPDCIKRGHRRLVPGYYICADGHRHIIAPEVCRFLGLPPTPENCARVQKITENFFGDELKVVP